MERQPELRVRFLSVSGSVCLEKGSLRAPFLRRWSGGAWQPHALPVQPLRAKARSFHHIAHARRVPVQGQPGPDHLCGQGPHSAASRAVIFPARGPARQDQGHAGPCGQPGISDHHHGKRSSAARSEPDQEAPPALQYRSTRRQAVCAFPAQSQASLPAPGGRAPGPSRRRALFRAVHLRSFSAGNLEADSPRLSAAPLFGPGHEKQGAALPVPPHGPVSGPLHGPDHARGLS